MVHCEIQFHLFHIWIQIYFPVYVCIYWLQDFGIWVADPITAMTDLTWCEPHCSATSGNNSAFVKTGTMNSCLEFYVFRKNQWAQGQMAAAVIRKLESIQDTQTLCWLWFYCGICRQQHECRTDCATCGSKLLNCNWMKNRDVTVPSHKNIQSLSGTCKFLFSAAGVDKFSWSDVTGLLSVVFMEQSQWSDVSEVMSTHVTIINEWL